MSKSVRLKMYVENFIIFIFDIIIRFFINLLMILLLFFNSLKIYCGLIRYNKSNHSNRDRTRLIKGASSYIYHTPDSKYYSKVERPIAWFHSVAEAEKAGFRAPYR